MGGVASSFAAAVVISMPAMLYPNRASPSHVSRAVSPFLVWQTKADVADLEFVEMGIRPAHRGLQDLMQSAESDAPRHDDAPHHHWLDMVKSDLQAD